MATYPPFKPGPYKAGERCTYAEQVWEKTKAGTVTVPPKAGSVWSLVPAETSQTKVVDEHALATVLGVVPDSREARDQNSALLSRFARQYPQAKIILNGAGRDWWVGEDPYQVLKGADQQCCINLTDFSGRLWGEGREATRIITKTGCVGIQLLSGRRSGAADLQDFTISHEGGRNAVPNYRQNFHLNADGTRNYTGHEKDWSTDWGSYNITGINLWSTASGRDISIEGFPGNGISHFGISGPNPFHLPPIPVSGRIVSINGDLNAIMDTPEMTALFTTNEPYGQLMLDGEEERGFQNCPGVYQGRVNLGYTTKYNPRKEGQRFTGQMIPGSLPMLANSCVFERIRVRNAGGAAYFSTGDNANKSHFPDFEARNIGGPGICDSSELKNYFDNDHLTQCSEHFTNCPPFTNRGDENFGGTRINGYEEQGNQPPSDASRQQLILGGTYPNGLPGGHGIAHNTLFNVALQGVQVNHGDSITFFDPHGGNYIKLDYDLLKRLIGG